MEQRGAQRLDHVGVVVRSLERATSIYEQLGLKVERVIRLQHEGHDYAIAFLDVGGVHIELIEAPHMLDAGAEPLHHICLEVDDVAAELARLKEAGVPLADEEPRPGAVAAHVAFLQPEAADGVRIELSQH